MLSTQCVLMNVLCPQPSITALIHSTDDDDDDSWKLIKLISTSWLRSLIDIGTDMHDTYDDNDDDDDDDDINCPEQCWSTTMLGF